MISEERWLPVVGYEGLYEVSDHGRVRSLDRTEPGRVNADGTIRMRVRYGRIRKVGVNPLGYHHLILSRDGVMTNWSMQSLVLEAFVGPRPIGLVSRHLDGNPGDNRITNLAWGTHSENHQDTIRHGRNVRLNNATCPHGHPYSGPNLRTYIRGTNTTRSCRACQTAGVRVKAAEKRGVVLNFLDEGNRRLAEIVAADLASRSAA